MLQSSSQVRNPCSPCSPPFNLPKLTQPPDTSPPAELHSTTLPPSSSPTPASLNDPTHYPTTHQTDHASSASHPPSSYPTPPPIPHDDESPIFYRPDSDALGRAPPLSATTASPSTPGGGTGTGTFSSRTRENKVLSGISNLSERDRAHLRQISDTTVSSVTTTAAAHNGHGNGNGNGNGNGSGEGNNGHRDRERMMSGVSALSTHIGGGGSGGNGEGGQIEDRGVVESPGVVSPPTSPPIGSSEFEGGGAGGDYLSARPVQGGQQQQGQGPGSPLRRSVFSEDIDGNGGPEGRRG